VVLEIIIYSRKPGACRIIKPLFGEVEVGYWRDIILNILLFISVGALIGKWKEIIYGFALSLIIEITKYAFILGYWRLMICSIIRYEQ
jgi:glycopeptide antibiotics resistance protein